MRHPVEVLVGQVRHARAAAEERADCEPFDGSREPATAPFVDARPRQQVFDGRVVDVEGVGQQLADGGGAAGSIHGILIAGGEQEGVSLDASGFVRPEEGADVMPEFVGQNAERRALRKRRKGEVHEDVVSPFRRMLSQRSAVVARRSSENARANAAEDVCQLRSSREASTGGGPAR